jgi:hypothetical protein
VLREWHPRRPVRFPARLLPAAANRLGAWMSCTADLGSAHRAALNPADLTACGDPGRVRLSSAGGVAHEVRWMINYGPCVA